MMMARTNGIGRRSGGDVRCEMAPESPCCAITRKPLRGFHSGRNRPRPRGAIDSFERSDAVGEIFRQRDLIPAVEQAHATHRIDAERIGAVAADDLLLL